ncbi:hypothetical protein FQN54_006735 [Arachnomyces sp. PD_36]|nr:hypothetical protein FQN54_006735 [Arachnomyces sp. PD_36]
MGSVRQLKEAFNAADDFLEELQRAHGNSIIEILSKKFSHETQDNVSLRALVIAKTLELLGNIHAAFVAPVDEHDGNAEATDSKEDPALEDAKRRRTLHALLDLISLEGIYPSLSKDVGIPLEQRLISVLPAGVVAKQTQSLSGDKPQDEALLVRILTALGEILLDNRPSIQPIIRDRILADVISGAADLALNPETLNREIKEDHKLLLQRVINDTPTAAVLPVLSSFLVSSAPPWFKTKISILLSQIPLRKDGVLQTIIFVTSQFAPSLGQEAEDSASDKPTITVQAIMQISRLLSSVPSGMSTESYIRNIAPKLLALIDGDDPDLKKVASYVIGSGILGKRSLGAPRTIGFTIFVKPILDALNGNIAETSNFWLKRFTAGDSYPEDYQPKLDSDILVNEAQLRLAIERLSALTLLHPNPGLLKRIIPPALLPLWGLNCFSKEHGKTWWNDQASKLLEVYFSISGEASPLKKLADHLLWDGTSSWTFGHGKDGGISIRKHSVAGPESRNLILLMQSLDSRADQFLDLLKAAPQADEVTGDIFLHVSQKWLLEPAPSGPSTGKHSLLQSDTDSERAFRKLVSAKIAEKLLEGFKDTLSRQPLKVLELIQHLIGNEIGRQKEELEKEHGLKGATLSSLGNIVQNKGDGGDGDDEAQEDESSELLSSGFSLLSTILTSPEFSVSESSLPSLEKIKSQLDQVMPKLPQSLSQPATTASMLLEIRLFEPQASDSQTQTASSLASDLQTHRQAISNIGSSLPPIQVEGLSALSGLIAKSSPILDIPSTISILLSLITGSASDPANNDEFVYLNATKAMGSLASRHPKTAVKTLVDRYSDKNEEESLDQRLRIGEALLRTVQELGNALVGETATILANSMLSVAGRRGRKPEAKKAREKKVQEKKAKPSSSENTTFPPTQPKQEDEEMDSEAEDPEQAAHAAGILDAWAAGAPSDDEPEDLRIRASAISILASAIETNIAGIGQSITSSSIDLALSTLNLEPGPESAILRRAAVILILDLVKAIDSARESGINLGFGFGIGAASGSAGSGGPNIANIQDVLRVLRFVESRETDSIVRGHIRTLIESLDNWVEKALMWGIGAHAEGRMDTEPRFEIDSQRLAGLDVQPLSGNRGQGRGPLIEEIE